MSTRTPDRIRPRSGASRPFDPDRLYCGRVRREFSADYWAVVKDALASLTRDRRAGTAAFADRIG